MQIDYSYKAREWLHSLPPHIENRILEKMRFYASQPDPLVFAKYIPEKESCRFRVGNYRILFEIKNHTIEVSKVERRDKVYD